MKKNKSLEIVSLFSGGGFLDLGFINQGYRILEAVEFNANFIDAYNYGIDSYIRKSQKKIFADKTSFFHAIERPVDASSPELLTRLKAEYTGVTGIIGGPPCQDFSNGGKNLGVDGSRGKLIFTYENIIKEVQPLFIFFENVAGLYQNKSHQLSFYSLKNKLEEDYHLWYEVLNALDYGIPQDRSRLALVGFRKDVVQKMLENGYKLIIDPKTQDDEMAIFSWPKKKFTAPKKLDWPKQWIFGAREASDRINIAEKYSQLFVTNAFSGLDETSPNHLERFEPHSLKFNSVAEGDTTRKSFKRLHRFRYSPTVAYGNNEVHLHPTEARRLSVREALRLQSVPDNYILPKDMSLSHKFKIISNGVPTRKAELIAKQIKRTLDNYFAI